MKKNSDMMVTLAKSQCCNCYGSECALLNATCVIITNEKACGWFNKAVAPLMVGGKK